MLARPLFHDRFEAGEILSRQLSAIVNHRNAIVLALPRGGVPVGFEVARALDADLDILLVRKLGVPGHEELAIGAIASGGVRVLNQDLIKKLYLSSLLIERITAREQREIECRERLYRQGRPPLPVGGRTVILVDDGLAAGDTMLAAARALRTREPERIIVAVPVAAPETCEEFRQHVDEIVCLATPDPFYSVGVWYEDFSQTSDDEVRALLELASRERAPLRRA
jgi:putative phosphoribosyl transferase